MSEIEPKRQQVLILSGLQASGKSTYAREWVAEDPINRKRINWDDLRREMYGPEWKFNRHQEALMQDESHKLFRRYLTVGFSVVVDNTNLTPKSRFWWTEVGKQLGAEVIQHEIDTDVSTCIERDRERQSGRVGEAVISRAALFNGFYDWARILIGRKAVIFDVDGTLADTSKRQHYVQGPKKDWKSFFAEVHLDAPRQSIVELAVNFHALEYEIIVVSGRGLEIGIATEDWLRKYGVPYDHLFMRNSGDHRSDTIVKKEILELLPRDSIAYVVDDRDSVVKMWRDEGLTVLQCAYGDF